MEKTFYSRLADMKADIFMHGLTQTGVNKHSGFTYFQLEDIEPTLATLGQKHGIYHYCSFPMEQAELHVVDCATGHEIVTYCGYDEAQLKGCQPIQAAGAVQTYIRRYLLLSFFGITEKDVLDDIADKYADDAVVVTNTKKAEVVAKKPKEKATASTTPSTASIKERVTNLWGVVAKSFGYSNSVSDKDKAEAINGARAWLKTHLGVESAGDITTEEAIKQFEEAVAQLEAECEAMGPEAFVGDYV